MSEEELSCFGSSTTFSFGVSCFLPPSRSICPFITILGRYSSGITVLISTTSSSFFVPQPLSLAVFFLSVKSIFFSTISFPNSFTNNEYCSSLIRVLGLSSTGNPFLCRNSTTVLIPTFNFLCTCINFIGILKFVVKLNYSPHPQTPLIRSSKHHPLSAPPNQPVPQYHHDP